MATISKIEIEGFKAFPNYFSMELGDKNLLMYGENGSGKSSIYYALHALLQSVFKDDKGAKYFKTVEDSSTGEGSFVSDENLVNIYRSEDVKKNAFQPYIKITLDNGNVWKLDRGGLQSENGANDSEIRMMNKNAVFINHSYISRFHAARNSEDIDLWNVFIKDILPFCVKSDEDKSLADVFYDIVDEKPHGKTEINNLKKRIQNFNERLSNDIIGEINKKTTDTYNQYFKNEDDPNLVITLRYFAEDDATSNPSHEEYFLAFDKFHDNQYSIRYPRIGIDVVSGGQPINKPQSFFNEAKLTAIALSVRFALLNLENPEDSGFLALDDMLISLDMSNRMKVVKYLLEEVVNKYKIYLFTHDKSFFEYFKHKSKRTSSEWLYHEIYMNEKKEPYVKGSKTYLDNADFYIKQHEYEIAGNFLRKEAEAFCKEFLPKKLHYTSEYSLLDLNSLICNCKKFAEESGMADTTLFDELDDHRKFVLNPASHDSYDVVKYKPEVKKCFDTLTELRKIRFRTIFNKGQKVKFKLKTPAPKNDEYEFEITIYDDFRLINQNGYAPVISKGLINYIIYKNGVSEKGMQSDNTTLKQFYDKNYKNSDKTQNADFLETIIDVSTGSTIKSFV